MDLERTTRLARAALENLERHRRRINALNVYPVPDGDTGTNLALTMRGVVETLERSRADSAYAARDIFMVGKSPMCGSFLDDSPRHRLSDTR